MDLSGLPPLLCLLLCLLSLSWAETSSPEQTTTTESSDLNTSSVTSTTPQERNGTGAECLIDNQMGLIAIGSAGGLIVCLLFTVIILACQVCHLQRRVYIPRNSRSNLNLSGSAEYWANAAATMESEGGLVGPCDTSVMMEEMKTCEGEEEREEEEELGEIREEEEDEEEEEVGAGVSPEEKPLMYSSEPTECDLPQDLEDMPLVV
ncbi:hypothetical protein NQD34_009944 [Periophthalmus magnuspinnatus]|nr:hypothetical protein NQD34_009944 [Periophthalmus magnuspinnatus]